MRATSTDQYVSRHRPASISDLAHLHKTDELQPNAQEDNQQQFNHRAKTLRKSHHNIPICKRQTSQDNKKPIQSIKANLLSKRIQSQGVQYGRMSKKLGQFEEKLNQIREEVERKRRMKGKKDLLREKIKGQRLQLGRERSQKRSLIQLKSSNDIYSFFCPSAINEKRPSFRLDRLGGMVTTELELEGRPFEKDPYSSSQGNIYYVSEVIKGIEDADSLVFQHIRHSIQYLGLLQYYSLPQIPHKQMNLSVREGYQGKKTVIFDLDQTLIHCTQDLEMEHDIELPIAIPTGEIIYAGINIRPGVKELLNHLYGKCEVIVFTASHPCYANVVLDYLDPTKMFIHHRLFRQDCFLIPDGPYVKDLRIINRQMSQMVLVDNAAYSYCFQLHNGIPIVPYYSGDNDFQLKALKRYLDRIILCDDVRRVNWQTFKLYKYRDFTTEECLELVDELYLHKGEK